MAAIPFNLENYAIKDTPMDGNCFFSAVMHQLIAKVSLHNIETALRTVLERVKHDDRVKFLFHSDQTTISSKILREALVVYCNDNDNPEFNKHFEKVLLLEILFKPEVIPDRTFHEQAVIKWLNDMGITEQEEGKEILNYVFEVSVDSLSKDVSEKYNNAIKISWIEKIALDNYWVEEPAITILAQMLKLNITIISKGVPVKTAFSGEKIVQSDAIKDDTILLNYVDKNHYESLIRKEFINSIKKPSNHLSSAEILRSIEVVLRAEVGGGQYGKKKKRKSKKRRSKKRVKYSRNH